MRTQKQQAWVEKHAITPEWIMLARRVLGEIQDGRPVMDALRTHPLDGGGYLAKYVLVAAYNEMVETGEIRPDTMEALVEGRRIKRSNKDLGRVVSIARLAGPDGFLGAALTQAAIAGVAFSFLHLLNLEELVASAFGIQSIDDSFLHHFEHTFFSLLFAVIAVIIFSQSNRQKFLTTDSLLGIIFVVAIAQRIIFIQKSPIAEVAEIESILKGDILFIGSQEFYTLLVINHYFFHIHIIQ